MAFYLFNTLTRKNEKFSPLDKKLTRMYSCGPTTYWYAHIGNFRAYICVDLLKRYLLYKGYDVMHVMNITDVEDKIIKKSREEKKHFLEITEFYNEAFFSDLKTLRIRKADVFPKATEHISQMVSMIKTLIDKGHAYQSEDGSIYYDISSFSGYGKLSHLQITSLKEGARVKQDSYEKENAKDFALWKAYDPEDGDVFWEIELGKGRPGWHIECSAMSICHLGEQFDIHAGGVDLIFPHHENEIAQSEGATGKEFAKYWFHNEHLLVDGKKMSKSLGNFYTLRDLIAKGHKASAIRYFLLSTHYRVQLNLTDEALHASEQAVFRINEFAIRLQCAKRDSSWKKSPHITSLIQKLEKNFEKEMDNDLDISNALAHLFDFIRDVNALIDSGEVMSDDAQLVLHSMKKIDTLLDVIEDQGEIDSDIQALVESRQAARKAKDFRKADRIRDELRERGIALQDTKGGVVWKKA